MKAEHLLLAAASALLLNGCNVGPDYVRPDPPVDLPEGFSQAQGFSEAPVPTRLWESFNDPVLAELIARALAENRSIAQAQSRLAETRALSGLTVYSLFPTVTAESDAERSKFANADPFVFPGLGITEVYRAGFDVAWEIDLFGSLRRQAQAIRQRVEADAATMASVQLSVVAEVTQAYFTLLGNQHRAEVLAGNVERQQRAVEILENAEAAGRGSLLDVTRAQVLARTVAAQLPQARAGAARAEQRLAVLTAWPAEEVQRRVGANARLPAVPALIAVGGPEEWLKRRPDVAAAERQLAAATSDVGVETAELFPKLNLTGSFGWTAADLGGLGESAAERWTAGPAISWQFLNIGRVRQRVMAAEARAAEALAAYEETLLLALEETESALATYRAASETEAELSAALERGSESTRLAQIRFDAGAENYLTVLDAERTRLDLEDQWIVANLDRMTALAALYKALAGDFAAAP
ncbi:MAG: TolC family protein [Pseudomonadota bacterium]